MMKMLKNDKNYRSWANAADTFFVIHSEKHIRRASRSGGCYMRMVILELDSRGGWCHVFPWVFVRNGQNRFKIGGRRDTYFFSKELYSQGPPTPPGPCKPENPGEMRAGFGADQSFWCLLASTDTIAMNQAYPKVPWTCFSSEQYSQLDLYDLSAVFHPIFFEADFLDKSLSGWYKSSWDSGFAQERH